MNFTYLLCGRGRNYESSQHTVPISENSNTAYHTFKLPENHWLFLNSVTSTYEKGSYLVVSMQKTKKKPNTSAYTARLYAALSICLLYHQSETISQWLVTSSSKWEYTVGPWRFGWWGDCSRLVGIWQLEGRLQKWSTVGLFEVSSLVVLLTNSSSIYLFIQTASFLLHVGHYNQKRNKKFLLRLQV